MPEPSRRLLFPEFVNHPEGIIFSGIIKNLDRFSGLKTVGAAHTFKHPFSWMAIKWNTNQLPSMNWCLYYGPLCLKSDNLKKLGVKLKNKKLIQLLVDADEGTFKMYSDLCH